MFCNCKDAVALYKRDEIMFVKDEVYGWVLSWIELTDEGGYTHVHRYGIPMRFCPMCGEPINK